MDSVLTTFIIACSSVLAWHSLPSLSSTAFLFLSSAITLIYGRCVTKHGRIASHVAVLFLGIAWMASVGHWNTRLQLPPDYYQQTLTVQGTVDSLQHETDTLRFDLLLEQAGKHTYSLLKPKVKLSWYEAPWSLKQGQVVRLVAKIKAPRGLANQHGFHTEKWLFLNNIQAIGYVQNHPDNRMVKYAPSVRQYLLDRLLEQNLKNEAWILALSLGFRGKLEQTDWTLLQKTGTAHLVAVSGLHVGLVAGAAYFAYYLLVFIPNVLLGRHNTVNQHRSALLMSWFAAFAYAWLAGFSVSTLRAVFMYSLVLGTYFLQVHWHARRLILLGMTGLILLNPLSLFSLGFWLSFSAVAFILFITWRLKPLTSESRFQDKVVYAFKVQCLLSALMLPLVAWQLNVVSFSSGFSNLLAIPIMSVFLLPLTLLATLGLLLDMQISTWLLSFLDEAFTLFINLLSFFESWRFGAFSVPDISAVSWVFLFLFALGYSIPNLPVSRASLWLLTLPFLLNLLSVNHVKKGLWTVDVLDVGQGLAVTVRNGDEAVLYDTGSAYPSGYVVAESTVLPFMQGEAVRRLNSLIISHYDLDHSGGKIAIKQAYPDVATIDTKSGCVAGNTWFWKESKWQVLWPPVALLDGSNAHQDWSKNDLSCVVKVDFGDWSLLFTGDIEAKAEQALVALYRQSPNLLQADVVIAPHHGSKTSSSQGFIDAVSPSVVVFSQGYQNRWGMPGKSVQRRYLRANAALFSTSDSGQVQIFYDETLRIKTYREDFYPYWYANKS